MNTSMGRRLCQNPFTLGSSIRCRYLANPHPTSAWSCDSAIFPVSGGQYGQVCGRIRAYRWGLQDTFNGRYRTGEHGIIDGVYFGGSPRQHIWTFAAVRWENYTTAKFYGTCPCESRTARYTPQFVTSVNQDMCILVTAIQL